MEITVSRHFLSWLHDSAVSLAFTTYQTNRLFLIGLKPDGVLSVFERHFDRPMGLSATADRLLMTSRWQLWELANALPAGAAYNGYDRVYVPRVSHTTGAVDAHDVVRDGAGRIVFVNTLYSCLAAASDAYSFAPVWQPPFISRLAPEDRCHLNGLALADGEPAYATCVSATDVAGGWRERRQAGGCVIDVEDGEVILDSLSMPHSPRVYRDRLWLANSGEGDVGYVDRHAGRFEPVAFCPGYVRGMALHGDFAVVGLSKQRRENAFSGLRLDERMRRSGSDVRCGLWVIDLRTGAVAHWLRLEGVVVELFDVAVLPGVRRPMALGFQSDEIQRLLTIDQPPAPRFEPLQVTGPPAARGGPGTAPTAPASPRASPADAEYRLGNELAKEEHFAEAIAHYEAALRADARHLNARINLGTAHQRLGDDAAALRYYRAALDVDPNSVRAHHNLALMLRDQGDVEQAIRHLEAARRGAPTNPTILRDLAGLLCDAGEWQQARRCLEAVLAATPDNAAGHNSLGAMCLLQDEPAEALPHFERAVRLDPRLREAHVNIGNVFEGGGDVAAADSAFGRALAVRDDPVLALHRALLCPPLLDSVAQRDEYRQRAADVIETFAQRDLRLAPADVPTSRAEVPFNWAYYGGNDVALRRRYAALFAASVPVEPLGRRPSADGPWRIGFVVTSSHEGVFLRCMGGIVDRLDRRRFTPVVACTQPGLTRIRQHLTNRDTAFVPLPHHFGHALDRLRAEQLDLLYFWEVGTDSINYFLAFSRLAPVQCTGWGWPISSAAPEIDFHLTSEALAPAAADAYFHEPLVRLPGLPAFALRLRAQPNASPPEAFGLPAGATLYLCPQNLRKVHPDFDDVLGGILRADPKAIAAFVHDRSPLFGAALRRRWQRTLPDVHERLVLLPRMKPNDYIRLVASARVVLDTPHFGGSNTAYDHLAAGVPAVTMPGDVPASRYTAALYAAMQIDGGTVDSPSAYVATALRLANDDRARAEMVAAIQAGAPAVFETPAAVDQLANAFAAAMTSCRH